MTVSLEITVLGAVAGLTYGLFGIGLVLVYRAGRTLNFAYGEVGAVAAALVAPLVLDRGWPYPAAFALAVLAGAAIGLVVELVVVRRLAGQARIVLLVATIGVAQLLFLAQLLLPGVRRAAPYPAAFDGSVEVAGVLLRGEHLAVLVVVPLVVLGLSLFMRGTRLGLAVRGCAENPEAARLAGVPVRRVSSLVWLISGALAAVTVVLANPVRGTVVGLPSLALGPDLLLRGLAAALVGRMTSFPLAVAGGVALGVAEATVIANVSSPRTVDAYLLVAVVALVLWRSRAAPTDDEGWSLATAAPARTGPWPVWLGSVSRRGPLLALGVAVALPWLVTSASDQFRLTRMALYALIGLSVVVVTGWAGHLSLCQFAFAGLGAMTTAGLHARGMPFAVAVLYGTVAAAVAAVVVGAPALRTRGLYLGITTLAFAVAARGWLLQEEVFLGSSSAAFVPRGRLGPVDLADQRSYYLLCLGILALAVAAVGRLRRTGSGRAIVGVRDNARAAAAFTVSARSVGVGGFALAGALAGLAGGLLAGLRVQFGAADFGPEESLAVVGMVIIGGIGSTWGAVVGAVYLIGLPALLGDTQEIRLLTSGAGVLGVLLLLPGGLLDGGHRLLARVVRHLPGGIPAVEPAPAQSDAPAPASLVPLRHRAPVAAPLAVPALAVDDLVVRFGGVAAVDHVSFRVADGEVVGLIGTNGAGKSTLMDAVSGFVPAQAGTVTVFGQDVSGWPPHERARLGMGRVFQDARLFADLTVAETIALALEARDRSELVPSLLALGPSRRAERAKTVEVRELLELLALGPFAEVPNRHLSTGTRRIVELATLVAVEARLVLLDEPTAGVAQREVEAFGPLLAGLRSELGCSVVLIEHDMPLVMSLSDRIVCMAAGRVLAEGAPEAVRDDPAVVAAYLGTDERVIQRSDLTSRTVGAGRRRGG